MGTHRHRRDSPRPRALLPPIGTVLYPPAFAIGRYERVLLTAWYGEHTAVNLEVEVHDWVRVGALRCRPRLDERDVVDGTVR